MITDYSTLFKNKLIIIEGADFSTKTTFIKHLDNYLGEMNIDHILTFQPGDTSYGEEAKLIRELTKREDMSEDSALFLYLYDRAQNVRKVVKPALEAGKTVVSDRWWFSTYAYQYNFPSIKKYFKFDEFVRLNMMASAGLEPDISFYLWRDIKNIDMSKRAEVDKYDKLPDMLKEAIRRKYKELDTIARFRNVMVVENDPEETFRSAIEMVYDNKYFNNKFIKGYKEFKELENNDGK